MEEQIRIKDKRTGRFMVDDIVLNGYGRQLKATGIAFYVTLCRFANNQTQQSYPSITKIQNETSMDRKTIIKCAKRCEKLNLIKRKIEKGKYTIYTLLEPLVEKPPYPKNTTTGGKNTTTGGKSEEKELREGTKRTNLHCNKKLQVFKKDIYKKILDEYQKLKRITLQGEEFSPHQHYIKLMLKSKRTPTQIIACMRWLTDCEEEWALNWQMSTVFKKLPEFMAGKLTENTKTIAGEQKTERTAEENQLIKFLEDNQLAKNPTAYIAKIKREYGAQHLAKLLDIEFNQWFSRLNYWTKSKV